VEDFIQSDAFSGEKKHSIDSKGRVIVPVQYRTEMGEELVIIRWLENSILMLTPTEWQKLCDRLEDMPNNRSGVRSFKRMIFSSVVKCVCDKLGRILIPENLRDHAQIAKSVTFVGQGSKVEIWGTETWQAYIDSNRQNFEKFAEELDPIF